MIHLFRPLALVVFLALCACSSPGPVELNDPELATLMDDPMPRGEEGGQALFEVKQAGDVAVALNLQEEQVGVETLYWVRIALRQDEAEEREVAVSVLLKDANGQLSVPLTKDVALLRLAGQGNAGGGEIGTYTGPAGTVASMAGFGIVGSAIGLLGMAAGLAGPSTPSGPAVAEWAAAYWLPPSLRLARGVPSAGTVAFEAPHQLPLTVEVRVGEWVLPFVSRGAAPAVHE